MNKHELRQIIREEISKVLNEMKNNFDTIIIHTPYGEYLQGEMYGNIHETHLSTWYEYDYDELEFKHCRYGDIVPSIIGYWSKIKI